jgi:fumarylacetoacetate (FAA) hydrolase
MKLASLKSGRDGRLIVVNRNLSRGVLVPQIATTLQQALDHWNDSEPRLQAVYEALQQAICDDAFDLDLQALASPFPRAYQFLDGSV